MMLKLNADEICRKTGITNSSFSQNKRLIDNEQREKLTLTPKRKFIIGVQQLHLEYEKEFRKKVEELKNKFL
jgi:hypothetical protein